MASRILLIALTLLLTTASIAGLDPDDTDARKGNGNGNGKKKRFVTVTRVFSDTAAIDLLYTAQADPYPAEIPVSGFRQGAIRNVRVVLRGLSHSFPQDLDMLLVAPNDDVATMFSDAGATNPAVDLTNATIFLDDGAFDPLPAAGLLAAPDTAASYRPANHPDPNDFFAAPAPLSPGTPALSTFDGGDPNGVWQLYIYDDNGSGGQGELALGWELAITARVRK